MFFKTITLSFCVALYFLQCQGGPPDDVQRHIIGRLVSYLNVSNAALTYGQLIILFNHVKRAMTANGELPSRGSLETLVADSTFTEENALACTQYIIDDDRATELVEGFFQENQSPVGTVNFIQLVDMIHVVKQTMEKDLDIDTAVQIKDEIIKRMYPRGNYSEIVTTITENLDF